MKVYLFFSLIALTFVVNAQPLTTARLDALAGSYARGSYSELYEFLSLPSNAHVPEHVAPNLDWLKRAFEQRGFQTSALPTKGHPLFFAEKRADKEPTGPLKTLLFYMHFDGQPVEPEKWAQESPYKPVLKERTADGQWKAIDWNRLQTGYDPEWRVFARASSDDKGPIVMLLAALTAMQQEKISQRYHVKVILDSEEEIGAPHLAEAVAAHKARLAADFLMVMDGGRHLSNGPTLVYGCRGIATMTLTTYGPRGAQHSGHYGNYAPNPALRMARLLASMKDDEGRVTIPGYYDGISIDSEAAKILAAVPDDPTAIHRQLGISQPDKVGRNYQEALQYPSLNVRGLVSANVGKAANTIVPDRAVAELDLRLVPESNPERLISLVRQHIQQQGYHIFDHEPTDAERAQYPKLIQVQSEVSMLPFRTEFGGKEDQWLTRAMERAFGKAPIKIRMTGGSVPIVPFLRTLNLPAIHVPMVNLDNNQHAANENLRLGNYVEGIKTCLAILSNPE